MITLDNWKCTPKRKKNMGFLKALFFKKKLVFFVNRYVSGLICGGVGKGATATLLQIAFFLCTSCPKKDFVCWIAFSNLKPSRVKVFILNKTLNSYRIKFFFSYKEEWSVGHMSPPIAGIHSLTDNGKVIPMYQSATKIILFPWSFPK